MDERQAAGEGGGDIAGQVCDDAAAEADYGVATLRLVLEQPVVEFGCRAERLAGLARRHGKDIERNGGGLQRLAYLVLVIMSDRLICDHVCLAAEPEFNEFRPELWKTAPLREDRVLGAC